MELHYTVMTIVFILFVLLLGVVVVLVFAPVHERIVSSTLATGTSVDVIDETTTRVYDTGVSGSVTSSGAILSSSASAATTSICYSCGRLRVKGYRIRSEDTIKVGILLENTYPVEVIIEKILLNDTIVFSGKQIVDPWGFLTRVFGENGARTAATIWINTGIEPAPGSETMACSKTVFIGNLTIYYRIPNVEGTHNITYPLKLPECMIKTVKTS